MEAPRQAFIKLCDYNSTMDQMKWIENDYIQTDTRDIRQIRRVLVVTMVLNFIATGIKLAAGFLTGALSIVADGLDSFFDGLSNVVGLVGLYITAKPPDPRHPYGRRKVETLAALIIAILLFLTTWQLLVTAWERLGSETGPTINQWTVAAMLVSMIIQAATSFYELRKARLLKSEVLAADAFHTRASILISLSVLGGLGLVWIGFQQADAILAAIVALVIAKIGIDILRENLPVLLDQAPVDPSQIAKVVGEVGGIESFHRVRSRGAPGSAAVDLHVRVAPEKTIQEANVIADEVRRRLLAMDSISDVTVHVEAQRGQEEDAADLFAIAKHAASELDLIVHEVVAHSIGEDLFIEMHIGVDPQLSLGEAHHLVDNLEHEILTRRADVKGVHTHIEPATTRIQISDQVSLEEQARVSQQVRQAMRDFPDLSNPHNIRIRRDAQTDGKLFISLECKIAPEIQMTEAHLMASHLEQELSRRLQEAADVSVHLEPPDAD
jgi:cation diffusion facilitator family transporter